MLKAIVMKNSPFYVQFYVSKSCHLQCAMCNIVNANRDLKPFTNNRITAIADNLVKIGAGVVLLTGGEPFLRNDIDEIVKVFKQRKLDIRLQTAGLYEARDKIAKCVEYGARDINVSIDSLNEELSDRINGRKGSWRNALKTIAFISQVFPRRDSVCALGCVLSPYNIDEIESLLDFASRIGWWLSLVPAHITEPGHSMNFRGSDINFQFSKNDYQKVQRLIANLKRKKREGFPIFDSDDYLDSIVKFISTGTPNWRHNGICDSPNLYFAILPDGQFAPCCDFRLNDAPFVYDPDFPHIYRSLKFREKVKMITQSCPGCNFGSFPEMTLSARSSKTLYDRIKLQARVKMQGIKPISESEIFSMAEDIRQNHAMRD